MFERQERADMALAQDCWTTSGPLPTIGAALNRSVVASIVPLCGEPFLAYLVCPPSSSFLHLHRYHWRHVFLLLSL